MDFGPHKDNGKVVDRVVNRGDLKVPLKDGVLLHEVRFAIESITAETPTPPARSPYQGV